MHQTQIVIPSGVPPTLFIEDLGPRTYAAVLNIKSEKYSFGLTIRSFPYPFSFVEGVIGASCLRNIEFLLLGCLTFAATLVLKIPQKEEQTEIAGNIRK
jgi:hypothetical protein